MIQIVFGLLPFHNKSTFPLQTESSSSSSSSDRYLQAHLHTVSKLYTVSRNNWSWSSFIQTLKVSFIYFLFPYSRKKNNFVTNRAQPIRAEDQTVQRSGDMRIITDKAGFKPRPSPLKQKKETYTEEAP